MRQLVVVLAFSAALASAQTGLTFTGSTEVTALHYNGAWGAANHTTESLDLLDWGATKSDSLSVEGHQIVAPSAGLSSYLGGVKFTPDISSLLSKTNLPTAQFGVFVQGAAGFSSSTASKGNSGAFFIGGGLNYRMTSNLSWSTIDYRVGRAGAEPYYEVSSGLQYVFNPQSTKSLPMRRFLARRAALARAADTIPQ